MLRVLQALLAILLLFLAVHVFIYVGVAIGVDSLFMILLTHLLGLVAVAVFLGHRIARVVRPYASG